MQHSIENIDFHDASISKIVIESAPDFLNTFMIDMTLCNQQKITVTFLNCFTAGLELSMWIVGNDSIRTWCLSPTPKQESTINKFIEKGFIKSRNKFHFISFHLNITNSCIEIIYEKALVKLCGID